LLCCNEFIRGVPISFSSCGTKLPIHTYLPALDDHESEVGRDSTVNDSDVEIALTVGIREQKKAL
jgi:hypothetical protein